MKKLDHAVLKVFLYGLPVAVILALFASTIEQRNLNDCSIYDQLNSLAGVVFGLWMTFALYLSARLLMSGRFRGSILPRLTFFKERDERELLITARATRNSFLTTLALLLFLLCLSAFQMAVFRLPPEQAVHGKTGTISLGVNMNLLNPVLGDMGASTRDYIRYSGLPLSNAAVVLLLILWQLGSYNYFMRRLSRDGADLLQA